MGAGCVRLVIEPEILNAVNGFPGREQAVKIFLSIKRFQLRRGIFFLILQILMTHGVYFFLIKSDLKLKNRFVRIQS